MKRPMSAPEINALARIIEANAKGLLDAIAHMPEHNGTTGKAVRESATVCVEETKNGLLRLLEQVRAEDCP